MKRKSLAYLGLLLTLIMTACGEKEETATPVAETVTPSVETVVEEITEVEEETVVGLEPVTVEEVGEPIEVYGEVNGFEYSKETSFNLPWAFAFSTLDNTAPQEYPGLSVNKYDAITEFKDIKYKDEGDLRIVELAIDNTCSYQLMHEFTGEGGKFGYVYSFTPIHPGDLYTGTLFAHENTSDAKNYYDTTTTLDLGNKKVDVRVEKVEEDIANSGEWMLWDEWSEAKDCNTTKRYTYKLTYPKDYEGIVFCLVKDGATDIYWEYQEEKVNEAEAILDDYTAEELIFVRLSDLINTKGVESESIVDMEVKAEEIRVRQEEEAKAEAEAKAKAEAEAAKRAEEDAMMDRTIDEMTEEEIKAMEEKWGITIIR